MGYTQIKINPSNRKGSELVLESYKLSKLSKSLDIYKNFKFVIFDKAGNFICGLTKDNTIEVSYVFYRFVSGELVDSHFTVNRTKTKWGWDICDKDTSERIAWFNNTDGLVYFSNEFLKYVGNENAPIMVSTKGKNTHVKIPNTELSVDCILEKIHAHGLDSLSSVERAYLDNVSKKTRP